MNAYEKYSQPVDLGIIPAILEAVATGDETTLRSTAEGREFLLEIALDRRKEPLWLRRAAKDMGVGMAKQHGDIIMEALEGAKK